MAEKPYAGFPALSQHIVYRRFGKIAYVLAGNLELGDFVFDPDAREWTRITRLSVWSSQIYRVEFVDGRAVEVGAEHRFRCNDLYRGPAELEPGDRVAGADRPGTVKAVTPLSRGAVVAIDCASGTFQVAALIATTPRDRHQSHVA